MSNRTADPYVLDGEEYPATTFKTVSSPVALEQGTVVERGDVWGLISRCRTTEVSFKDVKDVPTREHKARLDDAHLVPVEMVQDLLDMMQEAETGQAKLLSTDGETRRAANLAVQARDSIEDFGNTQSGDPETILVHLEAVGSSATQVARTLGDPDRFDNLGYYFDAVENELATVAANALACLEAAHAGRALFNEEIAASNRREMEEQAAAIGNAEAVHSEAPEDERDQDQPVDHLERPEPAPEPADGIDPTTGAPIGESGLERPCEAGGTKFDGEGRKGSKVECPSCGVTVKLEKGKTIPAHEDPSWEPGDEPSMAPLSEEELEADDQGAVEIVDQEMGEPVEEDLVAAEPAEEDQSGKPATQDQKVRLGRLMNELSDDKQSELVAWMSERAIPYAPKDMSVAQAATVIDHLTD